MDQVIRLRHALEEIDHIAAKFLHMTEQLLLAHKLSWSGGDVKDANAIHPTVNFRQGCIVTTGKDIHFVAAASEVIHHVSHIDVLSPTIDTSQGSQRRGMLTDHR